jgi:hypothetical protein
MGLLLFVSETFIDPKGPVLQRKAGLLTEVISK